MRVTEIFRSIQGESTLQGLPCAFVRLTGCNLDCSWCDTRYAREGGSEMSVEDVLEAVEHFGIGYVCITGGEPLLQPETPVLADACLVRGWRVAVETNGSIDPGVIPQGAIRVIDIKCPGSGEAGSTSPAVFNDRRLTDEYKFVIRDRADFEFACDTVRRHDLAASGVILVSPVRDALPWSVAADWLCTELPAARLNLQLHTIIWPESFRGR